MVPLVLVLASCTGSAPDGGDPDADAGGDDIARYVEVELSSGERPSGGVWISSESF